jgi:hypothetical protein
MCLEDVMKQRHRPKKRAGNTRQLLASQPRGLRVALEIRRLATAAVDPASSARKREGILAGPPVPAFLQGLPAPRSSSRVASRGSRVVRKARNR